MTDEHSRVYSHTAQYGGRDGQAATIYNCTACGKRDVGHRGRSGECPGPMALEASAARALCSTGPWGASDD